jgi:agmatinase
MLKSTTLTVARGAFISLATDGTEQLNLYDSSCMYLSAPQATALEVFSVPRTLEAGVAALKRRVPETGPADSLEVVLELVALGALVTPDGGKTNANYRDRRGMFGCDLVAIEEALVGDEVDVAFIGMPYELGVTGREGAKTGPAYLRQCSRTAFDYTLVRGIPNGWWSTAQRRRVLEGVRFGDLGDIDCKATKRNGAAFDRLHDTVSAVFRAGKLAVMVGGDHSCSLPMITAAAEEYPSLGILQFDAHPDLGSEEAMGEWREGCTHGNYMSWVAQNEKVSSITQIGIRHLLPRAPFPHLKVTTFPAPHLDIEAILETIPDDRPYYLSFDVDCLDPSVISQTGTLIPGGLSYGQAAAAIGAICASRNVIGLDFVELMAPNRGYEDRREGYCISYLLFEALTGIFRFRHRDAT